MFYLERNDKMQKKIKTTALVSLSAVALMALNAEQASADELRAKADSPKQQQVAKAVDHKASTANDKAKPKIELKADKSVIDSSKAKADTAKTATVSDTATDKSQDKANAKKRVGKQTVEKENKASAGQDRSSDDEQLTHGWDPELLKAVMNQAGITTTSMGRPCISKADAEKITSLNLTDYYIDNLNGLENLTNLTRLDIYDSSYSHPTPLNHNISDITPLEKLKKIVHLSLTHNSISDITPLKKLTNLTYLDLSSNNISDITSLKGLANLTYANLSSNNISDITPFKGLTNLANLELNGNKISDVTPLKGLTNLTYANLSSNNISDITPFKEFEELTELYHLDLSHNNISDITPFKGLTNLTDLYLSDNNISDTTPLKELTKLTQLDLHINKISDITPLKGLANLTYVDLNSNNISDITPLEKLTDLTYVDLSSNNISDITPIKGLTNLTNLNLESQGIIVTMTSDPINLKSFIKISNPSDLITFKNCESADGTFYVKTGHHLPKWPKWIGDVSYGKSNQHHTTYSGIIAIKYDIKDLMKASTLYFADPTLTFGEKKVIKSPTDGSRTVTTDPEKIKNGLYQPEFYQSDSPNETIVKPIAGETHVGNVKTTSNPDGSKIIETYDVNSNTGNLENPTTTMIKIEPFKLKKVKTIYEAARDDDHLEFEKQKVIDVAADGKQEVTYKLAIVDGEKVWQKVGAKVIAQAKQSLIRVGNIETKTTVDNDNTKTVTVNKYHVDKYKGSLRDPEMIKQIITKTEIESISAETIYHGNSNLTFKGSHKLSTAVDGKKQVIYEITKTLDGYIGHPKFPKPKYRIEKKSLSEKEIEPAKNGVTEIGNKEVTTTDEGNKHIVTTTLYGVDPKTGELINSKIISKIVTETKTKTIKADVEYIADDSLEYNYRKTDTEAVDGSKEVTYETDETPGHQSEPKVTHEQTVKDPIAGKIRVGNVEDKTVNVNDSKTIRTVTKYDVNPSNGQLVNPQVIKKVITEDVVEPVLAETQYIADDTLEYGKKVIDVQAKNGSHKVTYETVEKLGQKPYRHALGATTVELPVTGKIKVGNVKSDIEIYDHDHETFNAIAYDVNKGTGELTNPKVIARAQAYVHHLTTTGIVMYKTNPALTFGEKKIVTPAKNGKAEEVLVATEGPAEKWYHPTYPDVAEAYKLSRECAYMTYPNTDSNIIPILPITRNKDLPCVSYPTQNVYRNVHTIEKSQDGVTEIGNKKIETVDKDGKKITTVTVYDVDKTNGKLINPKTMSTTTVEVKTEVIPATTTYVADGNVNFGEKKVTTEAKNGSKEVTYTTIETADDKRGRKDSKVITPVTNGITHVGNKKIETVDKDGKKITTVTVYDVDKTNGKLINPKVMSTTTVEVKTEVIPATTTYVADGNVNFGEKKVTTKAKDGSKEVTYTTIETADDKRGMKDSKVVTPVTNGITHVGNVEIIVNGDGSKTVKVYNVDPKTGKLENPKVTIIPKPAVISDSVPDLLTVKPMIETADQVEKMTDKTADTEQTAIESHDAKSNNIDSHADKQATKTRVSLQTGVKDTGRIAAVIASVSAAIAAAYTAIRRRKN